MLQSKYSLKDHVYVYVHAMFMGRFKIQMRLEVLSRERCFRSLVSSISRFPLWAFRLVLSSTVYRLPATYIQKKS